MCSRFTHLQFAQGADAHCPRCTSSPGRAGGQSALRPLYAARPRASSACTPMPTAAQIRTSSPRHRTLPRRASSSVSGAARANSRRGTCSVRPLHTIHSERDGTWATNVRQRDNLSGRSWRAGGMRREDVPISAGTALAFIWRNVGTTNSSRYLLMVSCSGASLNASAIVVSGAVQGARRG